MNLEQLGWNAGWEARFLPYAAEGLAPGRVAIEYKGAYRIHTAAGEIAGELAGRLRLRAERRQELPSTGDFVALRLPDGDGPAIVQAVLPRRTVFMRQPAGDRPDGQVIAANIDVVFIMTACDRDLNPRRLERYLALVWEGGADPVVVLNKADQSEHVEEMLAEVRAVAMGVPVHAISALTGDGFEAIQPYLTSGVTIGFVGSSGVGKSTLLNRLLGQHVQPTRELRAQDSRGRHTTTSRQLFILPRGGIIIDTPGMRELQLLNAEDGVGAVFADIEALAASCRFADCRHQHEPGCGVREAIDRGELSADRLAAYEKLAAELRHTRSRVDRGTAQERTRQAKIASKALKKFYRA
jgi:ribosome biogenesis GTPase